jgi:hypothetical protein
MNNGTMIYDGYPRGVFDLAALEAYRALMQREVLAHPEREEAQQELDFVEQDIARLKTRPAQNRLAA